MHILTWHVHGSYLLALANTSHDFYLPFKTGRAHPYGGRVGPFLWPPNVHEVPAEDVRNLRLDCVLLQIPRNYLRDRYEILSDDQMRLPSIYLEHDPPQEHPTDTRHLIDDPNTLLVHVTPFNELMWDSGCTPTRVIEHGVPRPEGVHYTGELDRGIVVVNHLARRGRRLGADIFDRARRQVPLDLVGMATEEIDGVREVPYPELPAFEARYRFFFHPIRYTSLGLALCEAMMLGMPVVALGTTEVATVIENGVSGYVGTDLNWLVEHMRSLIRDPYEARRLGQGAQRAATERFDIARFVRDWDAVFRFVAGRASTARFLAV
ncbi:MAG: glycosyltransferase [Chloroflexi bacterium]|nr:glycosyltransferase [Chloroflexota bacterium]